MLDAVTGVSGSGPAYVFYFLEALEEAARELGLRAGRRAPARLRDVRRRDARWRRQSDRRPATLRAQVTSKGGTTERALAALEDGAVEGRDRRRGQGRRGARARARRRVRPRRLTRSRRPCDQALRFLLDTVFGLFIYAFLLRFMMQWLRAPFRNPLGQAVTALTDWAVKPLRRVLPGLQGHRLGDARCSPGSRSSLWLVATSVVVRRRVLGRRRSRWCSRCSPWSSSSRPRCGS